ncbi:MAG: WD40 repeat domain-containing protein [Bacteroidota bacterium]
MNTIRVEKIQTLSGHKDSLYTLEQIDDTHFVSAGSDGIVAMWDLRDPKNGQMIAKIPSSVYALAFQQEKGILVVGQNFSGIHLIDVQSKKEIASVAITSSSIFDIKVSNSSIWVATGEGEIIHLDWDLNILVRKPYSSKSARSIAVSPNGHEIAVGFSDNSIRILNPQNLSLLREFEAHKISVFTLQYHPQLPILVSGSRDARLKFWDIQHNYRLVEEIPAHMYAINHIHFRTDGQYFVTCSMDKSIKVWDAHQFKLLKVIDKGRHAGHGTSINKLLWMPYNNWIVSCSDDRTISIWDVNFADQ